MGHNESRPAKQTCIVQFGFVHALQNSDSDSYLQAKILRGLFNICEDSWLFLLRGKFSRSVTDFRNLIEEDRQCAGVGFSFFRISEYLKILFTKTCPLYRLGDQNFSFSGIQMK